MKKLLERYIIKNRKRQTEFRTEKVIKKKGEKKGYERLWLSSI